MSNKFENIIISIPADIKLKFKYNCVLERVSMSEKIRELITNYLESNNNNGGRNE